MNFIDAKRQLHGRFTYRADTGDQWRILRDTGQVWGDCEDYALTLIWITEGQSMIRFWLALICFKYVIWFTHSPRGEGHAVLWARRYGWADNRNDAVLPNWAALKRQGYRRFFPMLPPMLLLKFLLRPLTARL